MTDDEFAAYLAQRGRGDELLARLERLGFTRDFVVSNVLSSQGPLTVAQIAMLWQGMPNKHDRKRTRELFDALVEVGLLEADPQGESWRLTRT